MHNGTAAALPANQPATEIKLRANQPATEIN